MKLTKLLPVCVVVVVLMTKSIGALYLGTSVQIGQCAHIGRTCSLERDDANNPTRVTIVPCCDYLVCTGIGPNEVRNLIGMAHHADDLYSTGICTLSLDYNIAPKEEHKYIEYVGNA